MIFSDFPVLIVDDDHSNRVVTEYTLGKHFEVIATESAEEALTIISNQNISVLLTDQKMPGMTGIDLSEKCLHICPDTVRILISAYSDLPMAIEAINRGHVHLFIEKPWTPEGLISTIRQSILQYKNSILLKKFQEEQLCVDRIRSLGVISSGIAHDIRQPLAYINHFLDSIKRDLKKVSSINTNKDIEDILKGIASDFNDISRGVNVVSTLSDNLLSHVNNLPFSYELFSLKEVIDNVIYISQYTINKRSRLVFDFPDVDLNMHSCKTRVTQIILNLLLNASQSFPCYSTENKILLKIRPSEDSVVLEVIDNGCGISENICKKIFEPLFSTKTYNGTGLGLSICKINIEDLGGTINVDSKVGVGTRFIVELPFYSDEQGSTL